MKSQRALACLQQRRAAGRRPQAAVVRVGPVRNCCTGMVRSVHLPPTKSAAQKMLTALRARGTCRPIDTKGQIRKRTCAREEHRAQPHGLVVIKRPARREVMEDGKFESHPTPRWPPRCESDQFRAGSIDDDARKYHVTNAVTASQGVTISVRRVLESTLEQCVKVRYGGNLRLPQKQVLDNRNAHDTGEGELCTRRSQPDRIAIWQRDVPCNRESGFAEPLLHSG